MATVNEKLLSEIVAHEIEVLGYGNFLTKKIVNILNKSDENIFAKLNKIIDELPSKSINVKKVDRLLQPIVKANNKAYSEARLELQNEMQEFVNQEVDFQTEIVNKESPAKIKTISPEQVYSAALAKPFQGELLSEFFSKLSSQKQTLINNTVRMGLIEGKSTNEIVKQIRGTKQLQFKDGILAITRRNAESVVLTSLAHFQNFAQESLYDANDDIIKGFRYTSTLDTRTTELCASRDGNYYEIDAAKPAIPAHYRCRSRYVPVLKSFRELGLDADEFTPSTRASMDGQVPNKLTYSDWLGGQSVDRQNKVLGIEKAKLFRDGGLTLDKFVSSSGSVFTLDELRQSNAEAFNKIQILPSKYIRNQSLNEYEKSIEAKFYNQIDKNTSKLIKNYELINGNVIDPDKVKELNSEYRKDRSLVAAVHEPSSYLSKQMLTKKLNDKRIAGDLEPTIFTAGGSGSGKSATMPLALKTLGAAEDGLVYDSVLSSVKSATSKINEALASTEGNVAIVYTNTPITTALAQNALRPRAVSIDVLSEAHIGASNTIRELSVIYKNNPRVNIEVINNFGKLNEVALGSIGDVPKYNKSQIISELQNATLSLYKNKRINEKRYNLLIN